MVSSVTANNSAANEQDSRLQDLVVEADTGARKPKGFASWLMFALALTWSLFQLWVASPLPYTDFFSSTLHIPVLNSTYVRYFHLSFALLLAFMAYPLKKSSPRDYVPAYDWLFALVGTASVMYLYVFYYEINNRIGLPTTWDMAFAIVGVILLLESARRSLGPPMVIISVVFLIYTLFGNAAFIPDMIAHKGQSLAKVATHQWISTEGVFGVAIGVSADFVFLFVLFGALLEKAGAGNYFIRLAFSMLGHMRAGPAKAAIVSSAMTGVISGSSIANVVTTGTFTIPMMRKVGFSREKAGAVEVASSVNGQIMPPVMGAAAFLIAEYTGITYMEIVKHAFVPAAISYIALLYIVHLEALKTNMPVLKKTVSHPLMASLIRAGITVSGILVFSMLSYYAIIWIKNLFGDDAAPVFVGLLAVVYAGLTWFAAKQPPLETGDMETLPETAETVKTGLHYLLPIVVLVWCLMVERLSPGLSAFWASLLMIVMLLTQKPLMAFFRSNTGAAACAVPTIAAAAVGVGASVGYYAVQGENAGMLGLAAAFIAGFGICWTLAATMLYPARQKSAGAALPYAELREGATDTLDGLVTGARNMVGVAIATATAGIIVGTVSLTGVGQVLTEVVETISGGHFLLALMFTAVLSLILGMGLPTTANYIVVSSLMVGVIEQIGLQNGYIVPVVAIHLFVFYFGILADVTPPVGLASFAAAAVSGGDPLKTGWQAFIYSIRTALLPFLFIFNSQILLIGVDSWALGIWVFVKCTVAILLFTAAMQGYFITRNKWHETALLLLITFGLFRPFFFVDRISPPYAERPAAEFAQSLNASSEAGKELKVKILGFDKIGEPKTFYAMVPPVDGKNADERMEKFGLTLSEQDGKMFVSDLAFNSPAEKIGLDFDYEIGAVYVPQQQISKYWVLVACFVLLGFVVASQRRRKNYMMTVVKDEPAAKAKGKTAANA